MAETETVGGLLQTRSATCPECQTDFEQVMFAGQWGPNVCPKCIPDYRDDDRTAALAELKASQVEQKMAALDVPAEYLEARIDGLQAYGSEDDKRRLRDVIGLAKNYVKSWPNVPTITILRSPTNGCGKTHVAWAIVKAVVHRANVTALVTTLGDFIDDLREPWHTRGAGPSKRQRIVRYRNVGLLVLDDLSEHAEFSKVSPDLFSVVNWRHEHRMPTMFTTNEQDKGLYKMLGPALTSRAIGASGVWEFPMTDYRVIRRSKPKEAV